MASRPSALAWLVIPAAAGLETAIRGRNIAKIRLPFSVVMLGAGWFLAVRGYANETHAQRFITNHVFAHANLPTFWTNLKIGLWVLAVATGCSSLFHHGLRPRPKQPAGIAARLGGIIIAAGLLATLPLVADSIPLAFEHPFFENEWATGYLRGLVVAAAIGWSIGVPWFRSPLLGASLAALLLVSLRSEVWDYYLIDAALMAFFSVKPGAAGAESAVCAPRVRWAQVSLASALMVGVIGFQMDATGPLKRLVDHRAGADSVLEKALRAGWMKPTELSSAPFGFIGWHLLPYYLTHEGKDSADLGGFCIYVDHDAVDVQIEGVSRAEAMTAKSGKAAQDPGHPFSEIHPRGWFGYARFTLDRSGKQKPAATAVNWSEYRYITFPLNDAEWRELARSFSKK